MPVNELVRLVRVYSTPWEEKSAALKKLHEDYEAKQRQLNIAIKRLQLVDAHVSIFLSCLFSFLISSLKILTDSLRSNEHKCMCMKTQNNLSWNRGLL